MEKAGWIEDIITIIGSGRLRWYGHVMREKYEDWVKTSMECKVERRRPAGRPRRTWLENVEANIAELEIDKKMSMTKRNGEGML